MKLFRKLITYFSPRVIFKSTVIDEIEMAQYPIVAVPMYGQIVFVKLRRLTEAQIRACGDFSLIGIAFDKNRKPTMQDLRDYSAMQQKIVESALVSPSYDKLMEIVGAGSRVKEDREKLHELECKLFPMPDGPEKKDLLDQITRLEMFAEFILPNDFSAAIFAYAVGIADSDIGSITDDMLLEAARLATLGHDNPANHISGNFTDFNIGDINRRAWYLLQKEQSNAS